MVIVGIGVDLHSYEVVLVHSLLAPHDACLNVVDTHNHLDVFNVGKLTQIPLPFLILELASIHGVDDDIVVFKAELLGLDGIK